MRLILLAAAVAAAAPPSTAPVTHAQVDVPRGKPQQVIVQTREFAPGAESGWHVHPGVEIAYVTRGTMELRVKGKTTRLVAGDSFTMPRGVPHNGFNPGSEPTQVVITLVLDKGAEPRRVVPAP